MDIFDLDRHVIDEYQGFARSFVKIESADLREQIDQIYDQNAFWPDPYVSLNPNYQKGNSVQELAGDGVLAPATARVFRDEKGEPLTLHLHQQQAVAKALQGQSFLVTTGTGSGKSLCFFIPIVDAIAKRAARGGGGERRTSAIVIYPMNALANSQQEELAKYLDQSGLQQSFTYGRYTGQEEAAERRRIAENPPDILLTNFMMLELLMTRQDEVDRCVMDNCRGLSFLVLDELHTYRGRQGADVALLIRRVRERLLAPTDSLLCIGTSATMASEGDTDATGVAEVASRLFGVRIGIDGIIGESLVRATDVNTPQTPALLADALDRAGDEANLTNQELASHPLAAWIEMNIGLDDAESLRRRVPTQLAEAAQRLATAAARPAPDCEDALRSMLMLMNRPERERGGTGKEPFLAFKLHRFIGGAGVAHATLRPPPARKAHLEGQLFHPEDPTARLYPLYFCRSCGQEHHPVTLQPADGGTFALAREIDDFPPVDGELDQVRFGYLMPLASDGSRSFTGEIDEYPDEWIETARNGVPRLRSTRRKQRAERVSFDAGGRLGSAGCEAWFLPGRFGFCPACKDTPSPYMRDRNKLAGLTSEGRSSALTVMVSSALRWMHRAPNQIPQSKRKLLVFSDNRQDAALQAGHFNDHAFVTLLRAGFLRALREAGDAGVGDDSLGQMVRDALGFNSGNAATREEWLAEADLRGGAIADAASVLADVLAYRTWADQRRGWRFTNPNLEELGLVHARYPYLDEMAADDELFAAAPAVLRHAAPATRITAFEQLLDHLRRGLAVDTDHLRRDHVEALTRRSQVLNAPWNVSDESRERQHVARTLILAAPRSAQVGRATERLMLRGGPRSSLGRSLRMASLWGLPGQGLNTAEGEELIEAMLEAARRYGLVQRTVATEVNAAVGWRLAPDAVRFHLAAAPAAAAVSNAYFVGLYQTLATLLGPHESAPPVLEAREHTAQVDKQIREYREWRFRQNAKDRQSLVDHRDELRKAGERTRPLPALVCTPTMELGVDISALDTVYLRNVPPTPANYAQRSGRAGRSGQAALILTYCAAQSPHDQYFFRHPPAMVAGQVRPPAIDLANQELVESHLHAVWLAEMGVGLDPAIPNVLDAADPEHRLRPTIAAAVHDPQLVGRAAARMREVLSLLTEHLTPTAAPWAASPETVAHQTAQRAPLRFDQAFDRWRNLYQAARRQRDEAHARQQHHGLSRKERDAARAVYNQAVQQITLLESGQTSSVGSDFYTYRYLATEGFLPGYNFPRLPLMAYVPGAQGNYGAYLQRARFVAISEFGPLSLIYHEGRAYRVHKAMLPPDARADDGTTLTTRTIWPCSACGAAHRDEEPERCHACGAPMGDARPIHKALRIDNVETTPSERITANEEERQRRGFEIQTLFTWPVRDGRLDLRTATAVDAAGTPIVCLDYGAGALISRLNKGLRRRRERSVLGFLIDPRTGRWTRDQEQPEETVEDGPDSVASERIVPIVEDHKNALLVRFPGAGWELPVVTTLQHALARGIERVFQLEEGEILSEPLPDRERRSALLYYEASEGGAGVLSRLIAEPERLPEVAREAITAIHYCWNGTVLTEVGADELAGLTPEMLDDPDAHCVKGCYRCLLSYFNQLDHEQIDRTSPEVRSTLLRLARGTVVEQSAQSAAGGSAHGGDGESHISAWRAAIAVWGLPAPDATPMDAAGVELPLVWRDYYLAALPGTAPAAVVAAAGARGFTVVELPLNPTAEPPAQLAELLGSATGG